MVAVAVSQVTPATLASMSPPMQKQLLGETHSCSFLLQVFLNILARALLRGRVSHPASYLGASSTYIVATKGAYLFFGLPPGQKTYISTYIYIYKYIITNLKRP